MKKLTAILLTAVLLLAGCSSSQAEGAMDGGIWEGNTYHNEYLAFEITVPQDWRIWEMDAKTLEFLEPLEEEMAEENTYYFFKATRYEDEGVDGYPMVQVMARGMDTLEEYLTTAQEYLEQTPGILEGSNAEVLSDELISGDIGGRDFSMLPLQITGTDDITVYHSLFGRVEKGYMLLIGLSYLDQQQYEEALSVLQTLQFQ